MSDHQITKPCTCDGSNENCSRCFGTGTMRIDAPPAPPIRPFNRKKFKALFDASRHIHFCSLCKFSGTSTALTAHYASSHRARPVKAVEKLSLKPQRPKKLGTRTEKALVSCPVCKVHVRKLARHFRREHQVLTGAESKPQAIISPERDRLVRMGLIVPSAKRKPASNSGQHSGSGPKPKHSTKNGDGRADRLDSWKETLEHKENPNQPKNLDHTRPYAHAYRDQGQFGSHPSHDGFDDESDA